MGQSCRKFYIGIVGEENLTIEFKKGTRVESNKKFMKFYTLHILYDAKMLPKK